MRKGLLWPCFNLFLLFLAQNFFNYLFDGIVPPLTLIGVIYYSLKDGWRSGAKLGLFAGLLAELFGQGAPGFYMAQFAATGLLSGFVSSKIFQESLPAEIFLPLALTYLSMLSEMVFLGWAGGNRSGWECFGQAFRPRVLAAAVVVSPLLFSWLHRFSSRHGHGTY